MLKHDMVNLLKSGQVIEWNTFVSEGKIPLKVWQEGNSREPRLSGVDLQREDLWEIDVPGINLSHALLNGVDLYEANLKGSNLTGAQLEKAELVGCDLSNAILRGANLRKANISEANLTGADLRHATLSGTESYEANLSGANIQHAYLRDAIFSGSKFTGADISNTLAFHSNFSETDFQNAVLTNSDFSKSDFMDANLSNATLKDTNLEYATLTYANLSGAELIGTKLPYSSIVGTNCDNTKFIDCLIYGISAWDVNLENVAEQKNFIITPSNQPMVTVSDIEVAQFIYFMMANKKIRRVIDTMTSKAVLILGRFTDKRKAVLNAIREKLSTMDYVPIIFDFDKPADRDLTETVKTLAGLSKFIIMDLSDPNSSPHESVVTITDFKVPFLPILEVGKKEYAMFDDLRKKHPWVLQSVLYNDQNHLISNIEKLTKLAEKKYAEIQAEKNQKRLGTTHLDDL